jgi:hypothetical protein
MGIADDPYKKIDAGLHLESSYYNMDAGCYEPLIEPWILNAHILQKTASTSQIVEMRSDTILNLNLTYGMALAMRKI